MSTPNKVCKDDASKSDVCVMSDVTDMLQQLSTADNEDSMSVCANCGKEGSDVTNSCNKCNQVKYCNAACKKKHRHKHKKHCEEYVRLAAENAAELHDIELFKQPPSQHGDCPICFIQLPALDSGRRYKTCCGKVICSGCTYAPVYDNQGNKLDIIKQNECAFCRAVAPKTNEEMIKREKIRVEANDAKAIYNQGIYYSDGIDGYPQDYVKALELYHRAAELGCANAYCSIGYAYDTGRRALEVDKKKANHYFELGAMKGSAMARYNLGIKEMNAGNVDRALKHYMIAVRSGHNNSLQTIQQLYSNGHATKDDYTKALQLYQDYLGEIKSKQRDEAAAADDQYCYY